MTDISIPVQTPWDIVYGALTDPHILAVYFFGLLLAVLLIRRLRVGMLRNVGAAFKQRRRS